MLFFISSPSLPTCSGATCRHPAGQLGPKDRGQGFSLCADLCGTSCEEGCRGFITCPETPNCQYFSAQMNRLDSPQDNVLSW